MIWLDDVRVSLFSQFLLLWFFSHRGLMRTLQIGCCSECFGLFISYVRLWCEICARHINAFFIWTFWAIRRRTKREKNINELLSNLSGHFRVIQFFDWNDDVIGYLRNTCSASLMMSSSYFFHFSSHAHAHAHNHYSFVHSITFVTSV